MDQLKAEKIQSQMAALVGSRESLLLASVAADGTPHASYAPTVPGKGGKYYVHVSELAKHFHNLSTDGRVSALIIEDEKDAANIFARKRLTEGGIDLHPIRRGNERRTIRFSRDWAVRSPSRQAIEEEWKYRTAHVQRLGRP